MFNFATETGVAILSGIVTVVGGYFYIKYQSEANTKDILELKDELSGCKDKVSVKFDKKLEALRSLEKNLLEIEHKLRFVYLTKDKAYEEFVNKIEFKKELEIINKDIKTSLHSMEEATHRTEKFLNELLKSGAYNRREK
jgi:hypothetical protein